MIWDLRFTIYERVGSIQTVGGVTPGSRGRSPHQSWDTRGRRVCNGCLAGGRICFPAMTRKEFSSRRDALRRNGAWYYFGFLALIFALLFSTDFLSDYIKHHYQIERPEIAVLTLILVIIFVIGIPMDYLSKFLARKYGLVCPACGKSLTDKVIPGKVLVTGKCRHCKNTVFDAHRRPSARNARNSKSSLQN
jgi:hypothetical protein